MELLQVLLIIGITVNGTFVFIALVDKFSKFTTISKADLSRYDTTAENYDWLLLEKMKLELLLWQTQREKAGVEGNQDVSGRL